jgi:hypothetical protein
MSQDVIYIEDQSQYLVVDELELEELAELPELSEHIKLEMDPGHEAWQLLTDIPAVLIK